MARLSEQEKAQLLAAARRPAPRPPPLPVSPARDFLAFATSVSALKPVPKPARFSGNNWKL